ncbi:hypothetical protein R3P38DRAFT_2983196 [Favolaschia claudopus]|uniref:Membrane-associated protein n=1 Tax=Favolaschia claudopus TaxID=2862362 RepID=A0AAW0AZ36_9AGAR
MVGGEGSILASFTAMAPYRLVSSPAARVFSLSAVAVVTFVIVGLVVLCFAVAMVYSCVVPCVMRLVQRAPVEDEENTSDSVVTISKTEEIKLPTHVLADTNLRVHRPRSPLGRLAIEVNTLTHFGSPRSRTSPEPSPLRACVFLETITEAQVTTPVLLEVNMSKSDVPKDKAVTNKFITHPHLLPIGETPARFGSARRTGFVSRPSPLRETSNICDDDATPITADVEAFSIAESIAVALANSSSSDFTPISEDMVDNEEEDPFQFDVGRVVPPPAPFIDVPIIVIVDTDFVQTPAPQRTGRQRSNSFMGRKHQTVSCARGTSTVGKAAAKDKENNGFLQIPSAEQSRSRNSSRRRAVVIS